MNLIDRLYGNRPSDVSDAVAIEAIKRYFGVSDPEEIPAGNVLIYRKRGDDRFHLLTKAGDERPYGYDPTWEDEQGESHALAHHLKWVIVVYHFMPLKNEENTLFSIEWRLTDIMGEDEVEGFLAVNS